jgi:flagellar motor switch protein FliG
MGEEKNHGFFKTTPEYERVTPQEKGEPKVRRVAKFLVLIGSDRAAEILSRLPPEQVVSEQL